MSMVNEHLDVTTDLLFCLLLAELEELEIELDLDPDSPLGVPTCNFSMCLREFIDKGFMEDTV